LLRSFGEAVQKSVFVCSLDAARKARLEKLLRRQSLEPGDRLDWFRIEAAQSLGGSEALSAALHPPAIVIVE
jgi:CRISPR/Cas system-associated endoribonuclease Cas2